MRRPLLGYRIFLAIAIPLAAPLFLLGYLGVLS